MADVLLFHHVCGLTAGVRALATELRSWGHRVVTPDLFDGATFPSIEEGVAHVSSVGFDAIVERGIAAAGIVDGMVVAGISLGVMPAQQLAQTRRGVRGAILLEACAPPAAFGRGWADGVPVQIHGMDADPFFAGEGDAARTLVDVAARTARAELHLYPGAGHLFIDSSLPSYDAEAASLARDRMRDFLDST